MEYGSYGVGRRCGYAGFSTRTRALDALERQGMVFAGDPTELILSALPDDTGTVMGFVTDQIESKLQETPACNADTVAMSDSGLVTDPDTPERRAQAVAALAADVERIDAQQFGA